MTESITHPGDRPLPGVLFGITHAPDGSAIIKEPRILKVGIGLPKGPAITAWVASNKTWGVTVGYKDAVTTRFKTRPEAEVFFAKQAPGAPICPYPRKIGFFTFSHPAIRDGVEVFEPDWDAIEAHGYAPTEIDIVLLDDSPFDGAYQMWSASELKCKGDGINALRVISMATEADKDAVAVAKEAGEKYFCMGGCWTMCCPFSKETAKGGKTYPSPCKPGGDLKFQLACNIRVGGTAYFHSTGFRSISNIFSSLNRIQTLTGGRLSGIPLKMVLRPFKTNHNGQPATQYAVSLEFRAPDVATLRQKLLETVFAYREAALGPAAPRLIEQGSPTPAVEEEDDDQPTGLGAAAMAAEFYPEEEEPGARVGPERGTLSLDSLKPSADPNRGHDATAPVVEVADQATAQAAVAGAQPEPARRGRPRKQEQAPMADTTTAAPQVAHGDPAAENAAMPAPVPPAPQAPPDTDDFF